ncbi:MAG: nucleoside phosphorylase [Oscillospiraceae bacterium]|nr:nucleoside phosphorylase [Oscillospiraceae bacterium]
MDNNLQPHIRLGRLGIKYAILPGDPKRVDKVAAFLDNSEELEFNREYKSIRGEYKGIPILTMSTGMGGPSMAIAVEELKNIGIKAAIRIGSSGALKPYISLGQLIVPTAVVRNEGTTDAYIERGYPAVADIDLLFSILETMKLLGFTHYKGKIRSHDSFYTEKEDEICDFWSKMDVLGSEMESAALFVVGAMRGMQVASVLNVVVEFKKDLENGINDYVNGASLTNQGETNEIIAALESLVHFNRREI